MRVEDQVVQWGRAKITQEALFEKSVGTVVEVVVYYVRNLKHKNKSMLTSSTQCTFILQWRDL